MELFINKAGQVSCIYDEAINLGELGQLTIVRASHVEPDDKSQWWADLSPVCGPRLGPFALRSEALDAEQAWLNAHWLAQHKS